MVENRQPRAHYNVERLVADMTLKGWNQSDLARAANVSTQTVRRFVIGEVQTAKTADRMARALGYTVRRYLAGVEAVAS